MAAYAAVLSLKNIIESLVNTGRGEIIELAYTKIKSFQKVVERSEESSSSSSGKMRMKEDLEEEIRGAACRLEDRLEDALESSWPEVEEDIHSFIGTLKKMEEEYTKQVPEDADADADADIGGSGNNIPSEMVGLSDQFLDIRRALLNSNQRTHTIVGMAGIGKTSLANRILEDPDIRRVFRRRAFVKVGQNYELQGILKSIAAQLDPDATDEMLVEGCDEILYKILLYDFSRFRCLIVLDDIWNRDVWSHLQRYLGPYFSTHMLVTTRRGQVAEYIASVRPKNDATYHMRLLNKQESWDLLCQKVFADHGQFCPPQLEKSGKKIADNCEGLPLLVITVANLLHKEADMTPQFWQKIAKSKENPIFVEAYEQISPVIIPSYNYLPENLKACFLYMTAFPQNCNIPRSKLINLWSAEGFLDPSPSQTLQDFAIQCMSNLVSDNLVIIHERSSSGNRVKHYGLHSGFWHLGKKLGTGSKLLHAINCYADFRAQGIQSQRRLAIYKNILFALKDVHHSMSSISTVRSLLCTGPHHQYQVPICFGVLRLLKVLDAVTIRFYEFPVEVLKLVRIRYLALTYDGNLPPSISQLCNIECLIIHQYLSIKFTVAESYLPVEIWDLQELKYLEITGRNLPNPPRGVILPNLLTLLGVGIHSCTKGVLGSIPSLDKLRVQIELSPHVVKPCSYFCHTSLSSKLRSLQFLIMNPILGTKIIVPPPLSFFTPHLQKLTLSGLGYPWKDMEKIEALPYLKVLKLQCYAFRGERWEGKGGFMSLRYLLIEDTDLVQWTVEKQFSLFFRKVTLKNCYKLQEIPRIPSLRKIELVDCSPSAVASAKQLESKHCDVSVRSSWEDDNRKS